MPRTFGGQTTEQATIAFKKQQVRDDHIQKFSDNKNINIIWIDGRKLKGKKLENYINTKILPLL
jgi:predicted glycosyltransferase involved in capsule biosynthesis